MNCYACSNALTNASNPLINTINNNDTQVVCITCYNDKNQPVGEVPNINY